MKVLILWLSVSVFAVCQGTTFTLLHVNDTHSHLDAIGPKDADLNGTLGGIARAATVIGTIKATETNVILLHGGDLFQGDPFFNKYFGVPEFQIMAQLGFDAMTVGNHDLGYGPGTLNDVLSTAFAGGSFPLLSANMDLTAFPQLDSYIQPAIMKTVDGVNIGIFGMVVPDDPMMLADPVVIQSNIVPIAQHVADSLRHHGANAVILLSHLGFYNDKIIASQVTGIDFIIGAHDHFLFQQPIMVANPIGKPTPIFQAGEYYKYIGELHFTVDNQTVTMNDYHIITVDSTVSPEPTIQGITESLKPGICEQCGDLYHTRIGFAAHELTKVYDSASPYRDTPIGDLITDAFKHKTRTDIAMTADGMISEKIYSGAIVGADIFRSVSYGFDPSSGLGFHIAKFKIKGSELLKGLEIGLSQIEVGDDYFLQVSGMKFRYDPNKPVGQRVAKGSVKIDHRGFNLRETYTVTTNEGIVMMLSGLGVSVSDIEILPDYEFTVLSDYIHKLEKVSYRPEGRIIDASIRGSRHDEQEAGMHGESSARGCKLLGNYPNPFNPSTVISFSIPKDMHVSLIVYNSLGQEIVTLVSGEKNAGTYNVRWDAGSVASGVYFYRLQAGAETRSGKMFLIK
jgi:5'-nucleotidase / UDP-sugar diphosphatase